MHIFYLTATSHDSATRCLVIQNSYHSTILNKWLNNIWLIGTPSNQWDKPHWRSLPSPYAIDMILILVIFRRYSTVTIKRKHMICIPYPMNWDDICNPQSDAASTCFLNRYINSIHSCRFTDSKCVIHEHLLIWSSSYTYYPAPLHSLRTLFMSKSSSVQAIVVCYLYLHCLCCYYYCYQPVLNRQCII